MGAPKSVKTEVQNKVLWDWMVLPKDAWQGTLLREKLILEESRRVRKTKETKYKGELIQIHGAEEAEKHIRQGKWAEELDSDGETIYVKRSRRQDDDVIHKKIAELERISIKKELKHDARTNNEGYRCPSSSLSSLSHVLLYYYYYHNVVMQRAFLQKQE